MIDNQYFTRLLELINKRDAIIGVIGLGYVGLPLALAFADEGFRVRGFDIDSNKIKLLNEGKSYIHHLKEASIQKHIASKAFTATINFGDLQEMDAIIICVPTPLSPNQDPDLSYVENTVESMLPNLKPGKLVILESTTYPGTTEEVLKPMLAQSGLKIGSELFLGFSPEREDPGNPHFTTRNVPKITSGINEESAELVKQLYSSIVPQVVPVSNTSVAEMTKLYENIYRSVNIALANEMKMICDKMNINIWEVIEAAKTKPFGFHAFYPGPGLGGHCIPIDPFYLSWKAREFGINARFIELAGEINTQMPHYVIQKTTEYLNERGLALSRTNVLILGISYKKDVDDLRESPALEIIQLLEARGAHVDYSDPYFPTIPYSKQWNMQKSSIPLTAETIANYEVVMLITDHSNFDYQLIGKHAQLIVDTRGVFVKLGINGKVYTA